MKFIKSSALLVAFLIAGCNQVMGGPSSSEITRIAKEDMLKSAATPELAAIARNAEISPKGICNPQGGKYACAVDIKTKGANEVKTFVVVIAKDASGNWISAQ